jgi:uncharacterized protein YabE (DUF348 family)
MSDYTDFFNNDLITKTSVLYYDEYATSTNLSSLLQNISFNSLTDGVLGARSNTIGIQVQNDKQNNNTYFQSRNFVLGTSGWRLDATGYVVLPTGLRIDQTPAVGTITPDKTITLNLNGTNYKIAVKAA